MGCWAGMCGLSLRLLIKGCARNCVKKRVVYIKESAVSDGVFLTMDGDRQHVGEYFAV